MTTTTFTPHDIQTRFAGLLPDLMGIEFIETSPDRVVATLKVRPDLCTAGGILHGGSVMAFADTLGAVGTVINLPEGARTTTVESSTKFLAGAPVNTVVTGESTAFHKGRTTMVWQTLIRNEAGKLCAVVTQTQLVMAGR
ncbi:MAG: PaaI family thioesterase [Burkholderiales bacterium]|jgi:1,4-dihydroxy-2-naphthoyl-CoA hydrolase